MLLFFLNMHRLSTCLGIYKTLPLLRHTEKYAAETALTEANIKRRRRVMRKKKKKKMAGTSRLAWAADCRQRVVSKEARSERWPPRQPYTNKKEERHKLFDIRVIIMFSDERDIYIEIFNAFYENTSAKLRIKSTDSQSASPYVNRTLLPLSLSSPNQLSQ